MTEVYFSTDVETDGPIPGPHSMLSYASAAFTAEGKLVGTFTENLQLLPGATPDPDTMAWWGKPEQAEAWKACRHNQQVPDLSIGRYTDWIKTICEDNKTKPVFVAYPAGFDFTWMYWYMRSFGTRESPFSFSAIDIKTFAMSLLGGEFRQATKKNMPKEWFSKRPHTHVAVDDAVEQGELFCNMLRVRDGMLAKVQDASMQHITADFTNPPGPI